MPRVQGQVRADLIIVYALLTPPVDTLLPTTLGGSKKVWKEAG